VLNEAAPALVAAARRELDSEPTSFFACRSLHLHSEQIPVQLGDEVEVRAVEQGDADGRTDLGQPVDGCGFA
jgi:hypothetical protein